MMHAKPYCIGFNCALGAPLMYPFLQRLSKIATCNVHAYANAGLPNAMGGYDETAEQFAENTGKFAENGLVNMVGGCCGTTPAFIAAVKKKVSQYPPREIPKDTHITMFSGLEEFQFRSNINFVNIGERCNIAGSAAFKKIIKEGDYEKATKIGCEQVEGGAQIIDINLDDGLIDGKMAMTKLIRLFSSNTDIASLPFMIDSSKFEVIEAGLQNF